jgi:hypothetical protein
MEDKVEEVETRCPLLGGGGGAAAAGLEKGGSVCHGMRLGDVRRGLRGAPTPPVTRRPLLKILTDTTAQKLGLAVTGSGESAVISLSSHLCNRGAPSTHQPQPQPQPQQQQQQQEEGQVCKVGDGKVGQGKQQALSHGKQQASLSSQGMAALHAGAHTQWRGMEAGRGVGEAAFGVGITREAGVGVARQPIAHTTASRGVGVARQPISHTHPPAGMPGIYVCMYVCMYVYIFTGMY